MGRKEALKVRKFITGGWSSAEEEEDVEDLRKNGHVDDDGKVVDDNQSENKEKGPEGVEIGTKNLEDNFMDGVPIASFVRIRIEGVPAACVAEMTRARPLVLGGVLPGEGQFGFMQVRVKRHRWHPKLLKSGDALLLSVGWRRFQTVPFYSMQDRNEARMRYLKYSLEHQHCTMTAYGPMAPPNAGVVAFRTFDKVAHYRVSATGVVLESAPNFEIKKKLKLVGEPYKVAKNTAFIKNMFNSDLEVNKYMRAKIQTVSGIRGEIKKSEGTKGDFRATFEDRILMSDIVLCKCWVPVEPKRTCIPIVDVEKARQARLIGELRAVKGIVVPQEKDSNYGPKLERAERKFNKLKIAKSLEKELPFHLRTKNTTKLKHDPLKKKSAIVSTMKERAINSLLGRLHTVRKAREVIRKKAKDEKKVLKTKREAFIKEKRDEHTKENKKKRYREQVQKEQRLRKNMKLSSNI